MASSVWRVARRSRIIFAPLTSFPPRPPKTETTWSLGEYTDRQAGLGQLQAALDQPPGHRCLRKPALALWGKNQAALAGLPGSAGSAPVEYGFSAPPFHRGKEGFRRTTPIASKLPGEHSFVTDAFELKGHPSNAEISVQTNLRNNWVYFNFTLINLDTGRRTTSAAKSAITQGATPMAPGPRAAAGTE